VRGGHDVGGVEMVETISTSFITWAGLKNAARRRRPGGKCGAHSMTGKEEGWWRARPRACTPRSRAENGLLDGKLLGTASMTRSQSAALELTVVWMRDRAASRSASASLPRTTALSSDLRTWPRRPSACPRREPAAQTFLPAFREHLDDAGGHVRCRSHRPGAPHAECGDRTGTARRRHNGESGAS